MRLFNKFVMALRHRFSYDMVMQYGAYTLYGERVSIMLFTKMHGAGNDYIFVNCLEASLQEPQKAARSLSDRHFGVGGDGLVLILPSRQADVKMAMYNADGSEGAMCGNAIRCVGKYLYENGIVTKEQVAVETASGIKNLALSVLDGKVKDVTVNMGIPEFYPPKIPMIFDGERCINYPITIDGTLYYATALSMGNPHLVLFTDDLERLALERIGPLCEWNALFPARVNTEFVSVCTEDTIKLRVWERGSGETLACGTGACAAAVASCVSGKCGRSVRALLRGGELGIRWTEETGEVFLTGEAQHVFDGVIVF